MEPSGVGIRRWLPWAAAAACLLACRCHNPPSRKITALGEERVLRSYPSDVNIHAVSAAAVSPGKAFLAWSIHDGIHGMFIDDSGKPAGGEIRLSGEPAKFLAAAAAGCGGTKEGILLFSVPFASPLEGNKTAALRILDGSGSPVGPRADVGPIGPYSMGGAVTGLCDHAVVAWHTGKIGEFDVEVERIDLRDMAASWHRKLSSPGLNAFLPAVASHGRLSAVAWFEKKTIIGKSQEEEGRKGSLKVSIIDADGRTIRAPSPVAMSELPMFAPGIHFDGKTVMLVYKDHPEGEGRDGIYWLKLDSKGNRTSAPHRVGRADGPLGPLLVPLPGIGFSTVVLRRLAGDQLVGINILDEGGKKLQRELQIYSHGLRYGNIAAVLLGRTLLSIYSACVASGCRLYLTDVKLR
jgi:hypothetical protein